MVIQEKLNFLVENKDTGEVKYPHVYKLFHDLENYQEKKVFEIWMEKIAEPISVRIDYIKEYCDEEEKKEKGKRGQCDLMIALFTVYKKLKEKPYLCHCNTDSCFIKNNPFNNKPILEYEYYNYTSLHSLFWGYRSFPLDSNVDEENKRYKTCLEQMFIHLDILGNSINYINAIRIGFYDFDYTPVTEIQKSDLDCAYLERFISSIADKRRKKPELYIDESTISIVKENFHTEFWELENEFYILAKDIIFNKDTEVNKPTNEVITQVIQNPNNSKDENIFEKEPYYQLFQQIINDNFNSKMLVTYISKILEDDYQILSLREEFNFFFGKSAESIVDDICESKKRYTDTQAEQISLVSNHLEIILAYFESDKQITPLFIEKVTLFRDKIPCLSTILDIITKNDSKKIKDVENNLSKVWMYNQLIDILEKLPLFQDKECIKQQNEMIDNYITKLNIEKKSIDVYQNDRENLINEIISDINAILDKPKKKNVIVEEENNTDIRQFPEERVVLKSISKKEIPKVEIDIEAFKVYFKYDFTQNKDGESGFDKLINDMRGDLNGYNKKEIVALACLIHRSGNIHSSKYTTVFSKWLRNFCALINVDIPTSKPNQVEDEIIRLKDKYYYLFS